MTLTGNCRRYMELSRKGLLLSEDEEREMDMIWKLMTPQDKSYIETLIAKRRKMIVQEMGREHHKAYLRQMENINNLSQRICEMRNSEE